MYSHNFADLLAEADVAHKVGTPSKVSILRRFQQREHPAQA